METLFACVITGCFAVLASSGFWAWLTKRGEKNSAEAAMLRGLGHDRIMELGSRYLDRGWLTSDEYENLKVYLYEPYEKLGGNGTARHIMERVDKLKIRPNGYVESEGEVV